LANEIGLDNSNLQSKEEKQSNGRSSGRNPAAGNDDTKDDNEDQSMDNGVAANRSLVDQDNEDDDSDDNVDDVHHRKKHWPSPGRRAGGNKADQWFRARSAAITPCPLVRNI
jgi:hypothetical protein